MGLRFLKFMTENESSDGFSDLMGAAGDPTGDVVGEEVSSGPSQGGGIPESEPEYEYTARKGIVKEKLSMILKRASQGYDYAQVMSEANLKQKEYESKYKHYEAVDKYAQENKDWWENINKSYQERLGQTQAQPPQQTQEQAQTGIPPELQTMINPLAQELSSLKESIGEILKERQEQVTQREDAALAEQITGVRQKYGNVDFDTPDENGQSLEVKVLNHAQENGIKNFRTAFLDYYHDDLTKLHEEKGQEAAMKNLQSKSRLGLLKQSTPKSTPQRSIRETSYNDLVDQALNEI